MLKVESTQDEINTIGKYIDISLRQNGISILKEAFVILTRLESATEIKSEDPGSSDKRPPKS